MSDGQINPQAEADRVRLKRLAKLGGPASPSPSTSASPAPSTSTPPPASKPIPPPSRPSSRPAATPAESRPVIITPRKATPNLIKFDFEKWEDYTIGSVLRVTLDREQAEKSNWETVWLKNLQEELASEDSSLAQPIRLHAEIADRLLISRLEVDPDAMSDDLDYLPVLASLPPQQTVFELLVGCWQRHNAAKAALIKRNIPGHDAQRCLTVLDKLRDLIISYAGLTLQEPEMFRQPQGKPIGPPELVSSLLSLSALSVYHPSRTSGVLSPTEVSTFLTDIALRFSDEDELIAVLNPVICQLLFHQSLLRPDGLSGADAVWRGVIAGMEALVGVKAIANIITKLPEWNPHIATPSSFERVSLMGPLMRLGVFMKDWPVTAQGYFSEPEKRTRPDVESSNASLRGTLKSFQSSLFQIFNALVRASADSRERVLQYFSRVVTLNVRRSGLQVEYETVASDSFMINVQTVLLRFAEPFMDATYSKIDKIDSLYLAHSSRVDVKEETRIKATSDEAVEWAKEVQQTGQVPAPNFITEIFYILAAVNHYGLNRTLQSFDDLHKHVDELERHLEYLQGDAGTWAGTPLQARHETAVNQAKAEISKIHTEQFAYQVQLLDPEFVFRQLGFTCFLETWLLRLVDPKGKHPKPIIEIPLPKEIPTVFRMLPEYFLEDVIDYLLSLMRNSPQSFDLTGKRELVIFALTFLRSSWYIKNPFLKAKINEMLFFGVLGYGREQNGVLGNLLNTDPLALQHLIPAMTSFYIEVEQTGASSQFYDKFNARRNIAYILKAVWNNPSHREALNKEAKDVDKFVRFVNLMINDVTYLLDESLSELTQIANIQHEMSSPEWATRTPQQRRERESTLRGLERHASGYTTLGRSTVDLLKLFTAETKQPFMMPEIVDRLAAMLDYNLEALCGPKCGELAVKDPEKYRFNPRALLSDIFQIYLNLGDQPEFVTAVASDGRSYKKETFERCAGICRKRNLKTSDEIEQLRVFVVKVEEKKATIEAEEDLGEIPDEFLDPLMYTLMRDPVILPSSHITIDRATIKSHLLSDSKDPFNRSPLSIEDVVPNVELKAKIEVFLVERLKNKPSALTTRQEDIVNMDQGGDEHTGDKMGTQ